MSEKQKNIKIPTPREIGNALYKEWQDGYGNCLYIQQGKKSPDSVVPRHNDRYEKVGNDIIRYREYLQRDGDDSVTLNKNLFNLFNHHSEEKVKSIAVHYADESKRVFVILTEEVNPDDLYEESLT